MSVINDAFNIENVSMSKKSMVYMAYYLKMERILFGDDVYGTHKHTHESDWCKK